MSELKGCPFCGNRSVRTIEGRMGKSVHHMITCDTCLCTVSFEDKSMKNSAIKAWNRRKYGDSKKNTY